TGAVADRLAAADRRVRVLHRTAKAGLGAAYQAGFDAGLTAGYEVLVQLDADGSHPPERLPVLLAALAGADLVIGSRWVAGGAVRNWPWPRQALSRAGNGYVRLVLGLRVRDATAGYRVWRAEALRRVDLAGVASQGYCFQVDLTRRAVHAGCRVVEVPITFVERTAGASKMSGGIVAEALWRVTGWGLADRWARRGRVAAETTGARS
ncbi:MAG: glycosyltransferase, partial [Actinomycetota bacterium]|nr:glycosyltransferase [Actinomycetota bacterium]